MTYLANSELTRGEIIVRDGKGGKDRVTMLPRSLLDAMRRQLEIRREWHEQDIKLGKADVWLPNALAVKYPEAPKDWGWQYVFAARKYSIDPRSQAEQHSHIGAVSKWQRSSASGRCNE